MGLISRVSSRTYRSVQPTTAKMVCVPCIFIPVLLWIYNKFLQPIVEPIFRRWMGKPEIVIKKKDDDKTDTNPPAPEKTAEKQQAPEEPSVAPVNNPQTPT